MIWPKNETTTALLLAMAILLLGLGAALLIVRRSDRSDCFEHVSKEGVLPWFSTVVVNGKLLVCFDGSTGSVDVLRCVEMKRCPPALPSEEDSP